MKRTTIMLAMLAALVTAAEIASFAAASASLTGPSTVRAGDTIKLTLSLNPLSYKEKIYLSKYFPLFLSIL